MKNFIKKVIHFISMGLPAFWIYISLPTLRKAISIETIIFNVSIFMHQLISRIMKMQNDSTSSMISLTMEANIHAMSARYFLTEETLPNLGSIFTTHWTFDWSFFKIFSCFLRQFSNFKKTTNLFWYIAIKHILNFDTVSRPNNILFYFVCILASD